MLLRCVCALLAGAMLAQAFEPVGLALLLPVGVAGMVLCVRDLPARRAWLPGLAFGIGFQFVLLFWMRAVGLGPWFALAGLEAAYFAPLGSAAAVLLRLRGGAWWFGAAWVAVETVRSDWPFSGMPWGRLSYAVAGTAWQDTLPYAGMAGLSFLLAALGALLARLVTGPGRARAALVGAAVAAVSTAPTLGPWTAPVTGERTVAVVQGDVPGDGTDILLDHEQVTRNHVDATVALAEQVAAGERAEPDFVVWPENSTAVDPFYDSEVNAGIERASAAVQVPLLLGAMVDAGAEHVLNQGIVWLPGTGAADRYTKWHPVPFGEYIPWRDLGIGSFGQLRLIPRDMLGGTRTEPLEVGDTLVADAICFDVAYDDGIHEQLRSGGQLLAVQTSNAMFVQTSQIEQQFEISRLRAVETGRYVLVAATNGVSGVIAPDGTVEARAGIRTQQVLVEDVELAEAPTPAVRLGAWPGRLAIAATVVGLLVAALAHRRRRRSESGPT